MSDVFKRWLDATISQVEQLRDQGVRYVSVSPAIVEALARPARPRAREASAASPEVGVREVPVSVSRMDLAVPAPVSVGELGSTGGVAGLDSPRPVVAGRLEPGDREAKEAAMAELRSRALVCRRCPQLAASRTQVVFGVGDIHSPLMFVGEAPGADEDRQGEPFVGRAGQLLTKIIEAMGLGRDQVYIGNILKCRPDTPGQRSGNRKPSADEMRVCLPYLLEQVDIIQPRVLVALGATAVEGLFGRAMPITRVRGSWLEFRGIPVMPTYHPAYLLRNQSMTEKRKVWEDMLQVMERLRMSITEKQRNYFLGPRA